MAESITLPILCFNDVYRVSQRYVPQPGAPSEPTNISKANPRSTTGGTDDAEAKISVSQFGELLLGKRSQWTDGSSSPASGSFALKVGGEDGVKDGLVLFAGDVFNPSVESSVTRGSHMVPIMNALKVDCACIGNHDFDFGFPHLTKLLESTTFPWLLSNIVDESTGTTPEPLKRFWVTERCGVRIGVVGLVEPDWIATIPSWPSNFTHRDMVETAISLSKELRDPDGPHKVDLIIALTHCRVPNDIKLCNDLGAVAGDNVSSKHGVDLVIGGHDHMYYIGKGAAKWTGFAGDRDAKGTESDKACYLIKSGTDFRDLTSASLTLASHPDAVRRRTISQLEGEHVYVTPSLPASKEIDHLLSTLLSSVSDTLSKPVCFTLTPFDARSEIVRTRETGLGNWVADVLLHAYAESGVEGGPDWFEKDDHVDQDDHGRNPDDGGDEQVGTEKLGSAVKAVSDGGETGSGGAGGSRTGNGNGKGRKEQRGAADAVIICGGTLRGDSQYGPGKITLGDILEILPFEDPAVCLEIDGEGIWTVLEGALSKWPAQEGRFPIIAGLYVKWDHTLPPGQRIESIHLTKRPEREDEDDIEDPDDMVDFIQHGDGVRVEVKQRKVELGQEVKRDASRMYRVITREYMAQGYDGFEGLKNRKFIIDDESGQIMSSIIRSFLLGSAYIFRHKQLMTAHSEHLSSRTSRVLNKARHEHNSPTSSLASSPMSARGGPHPPWGSGSISGLSRSPLNPDRVVQSPISPGLSESVGSLFRPAPAVASASTSPAKDASGVPVPASATTIGASPAQDGWGAVRRHVVKHDWTSIRDALWIGRHEHMSDVDHCKGDDLRTGKHSSSTPAAIDIPTMTSPLISPKISTEAKKDVAAVFIKDANQDELKKMGEDIAIVCPLVDGRLTDVGEGK